jgi:hypothetical protein
MAEMSNIEAKVLQTEPTEQRSPQGSGQSTQLGHLSPLDCYPSSSSSQ